MGKGMEQAGSQQTSICDGRALGELLVRTADQAHRSAPVVGTLALMLVHGRAVRPPQRHDAQPQQIKAHGREPVGWR